MSISARRGLIQIIAVVVSLSLGHSAAGQSIIGAQTALDNVSGAGGRAPGNMVSAGVAQTIDFGNRAFAGTVITEAAPGTSIRAETIAASLNILFEQLNLAIVAFHNLLRARAGLSPVLPAFSRTKTAVEAIKPGRLASPERLGRFIKSRHGDGRG